MMTQTPVRSLTRVTAEFLDKPVSMKPEWASVLVSAVRQQLNIDLFTDVEGSTLDGAAMDALAIEAQSEVQERNTRKDKPYPQYGNMAVIEVVGVITRKWGLNPFSGFTGQDGIKAKIVAANDDPTVDGILVDIDSPGGSVAGLFDLADFIYQFSARNGCKPIWAIANEQMCSAAYIAFSAADRIIATRTADVGSIACLLMVQNIQKQLDDKGISVTFFRSLSRKAELNQYEKVTEEISNKINEELSSIQNMIDDTVARNRSSNDAEFNEFKKKVSEMQGLTYMGSQARDMGLVDDIMSEDQVFEEFSQFLNN